MTESVELSLARYNELIVKEERCDNLEKDLAMLQRSLKKLVCDDIARYGEMMRFGTRTGVKASEIAIYLHMAISPNDKEFAEAMKRFDNRLLQKSKHE